MTLFTGDFASIRDAFAGMKLDLDAPGFYDHPAFQELQARDPEALGAYAKYVLGKPHSPAYLAAAERTIRIVCGILHDELVKDGRLGACIDLSMVMSRILDKLGVWNFIVNGAVTTIYPAESGFPNGYYWPIHQDAVQAGHAWVCAPPFTVIDMTIGRQPDVFQTAAFAPEFVYSKTTADFPVYIEDLCSDDTRSEMAGLGVPLTLEGLFTLHPRLQPFLETFQGTLYSQGALHEYIPVYILEPSGSLEQLTDLCLSGKYGSEIWEEKIAPLFA